MRARQSMKLFFFSSRRRHTRYIGDWSSDVCSSDLMAILYVLLPLPVGLAWFRAYFEKEAYAETIRVAAEVWGRSEERRVGKECRSRGSTDHENKITQGTLGSTQRGERTADRCAASA